MQKCCASAASAAARAWHHRRSGVASGVVMVNWDTVRSLALALPEVEERTSYGTPGFRVRDKLFARLREDGELLVLRVGVLERETLIAEDPAAFLITPHYESSEM